MDFKLPQRYENSHKGTYGKVLNVSGSKYMTGAAYLSSIAALKSGCGYVFLCSCEECIRAVAAQTQAVVFVPVEDLKLHLPSAQAVLIGCGLGVNEQAVKLFSSALSDKPTVIDADGLNILAEYGAKNLPEKLVLTPHPKEASRLLGGVGVEEILNDTEKYSLEISKKYNAVTVLKTHKTVVTSPNGKIYRNTTGNSAMAKAGSGDVLAGMITSFIAQGTDIFEASCLGVYTHGLAGDFARDDLTPYCVLPSDIINHIPCAFKTLL